jgi:hypothetical protein
MSPRDSFGFGIQAFDSDIQIECSSPEHRDLLNRYVFPPLARSRFVSEQPDIEVQVWDHSGGTKVSLNGELIALVDSPIDATLAAVKALDNAVVRRLKNYRAIHAGAVLLGDRALILPGLTHAGKSSLTAELLRHGASCFSDEYALIDKNGKVHLYPRPLLLRHGSPRQSIVLPEELNAKFAAYPASVGWIVAVDYIAGDQWGVRLLPQSEAVLLLLRNTPHEMAQSPELVDFFHHAVASAVCYEGRRGDAEEAIGHILDLVRKQ